MLSKLIALFLSTFFLVGAAQATDIVVEESPAVISGDHEDEDHDHDHDHDEDDHGDDH
ncbi:MAG: hypothetical protein MRY32_05665 [Rickettsiales bacterium]|nr:hypothetical protein [Rickettsiales bacterium]